jgi:G3E family GTPase
MDEKIPVTVFTGFLGAGKTTIILNLIKQLPKGYKSVWLKNEYGSEAIDSELAKENNIAVKEMINGCICCVLIGRLGQALEEIVDKYHPQRIIIETSGTAYPGPIALEIRKLSDQLILDGLVNVIDAINFPGYKDKSYTARLSTQFTDLILINKHEQVEEHHLDKVLDDVYDLNSGTPKVKTDHGLVNPDLVFGLDSQLYKEKEGISLADHHEAEVMELKTSKSFESDKLKKILSGLTREDFYRIKGMVKTGQEVMMLNYVFGRYDLQPLKKYRGPTYLLFLGQELKNHQQELKNLFSLDDGEIKIL